MITKKCLSYTLYCSPLPGFQAVRLAVVQALSTIRASDDVNLVIRHYCTCAAPCNDQRCFQGPCAVDRRVAFD